MSVRAALHISREAWIGGKFLLLAAAGSAIYFVASLPLMAAALAGCAGLHFAFGMTPARIFQPLRTLAPFLLFIGGAVLFFDGAAAALLVVMRLATLVLAAHLVTETTGTGEMTDAFVAGLSPLRPLGVSPERAGMALGLTLRFIPMLATVAREVIEAQKARGHHRNIVAIAVPLIVRSLRMADDVSEALEARGFDAGDAGNET